LIKICDEIQSSRLVAKWEVVKGTGVIFDRLERSSEVKNTCAERDTCGNQFQCNIRHMGCPPLMMICMTATGSTTKIIKCPPAEEDNVEYG